MDSPIQSRTETTKLLSDDNYENIKSDKVGAIQSKFDWLKKPKMF